MIRQSSLTKNVLGCLLFCAVMIFTESAFAFTAKRKSDYTDSLVRENESLSVDLEDTVQEAKPESRRTFEFFIGRESADRLSLYLNGQETNYNLSGYTAATIQYGYYPYRKRLMLGVIGGVGYGYLENHVTINGVDRSTSLHLIPIDLMMATRFSVSSRLEMQAGLGAGVMSTIQRGDELDNSSQAKGYGVGQLGLVYGPKLESDLPWEVVLMYGRRFASTSASQSWNGDYVRLGFGVRLD